MNLPLTDQQDLRDVYSLENFSPDHAEARARLEAKYPGQVSDIINAYGPGLGNPALTALAAMKDADLLNYMNTTPFVKYAKKTHNKALGFSTWSEALTLIGRANLIPQLK